MSMNPGATTQPSASMTRAAREPARPTRLMRSPDTPTSAVKGGRPLPSTTVPPRRRRSSIDRGAPLVAVLDAVHARGVGPEDLPSPGRGHILHVLHQLV